MAIGGLLRLICFLLVLGAYVAPAAAQTVTSSFTVVDTIPPAAITDLRATSITEYSVTLAWTAPGDDGTVGTATSYDLRYATFPITSEGAWAAATQVTGEPGPHASGATETCMIIRLTAYTTYYFAIRSSDEIPNMSALSNSPRVTTLEEGPPVRPTPTSSPYPEPGSDAGPIPTSVPSVEPTPDPGPEPIATATPDIGPGPTPTGTPEPTPPSTPPVEPTPGPTPSSTPTIEPTPSATPIPLDLRSPEVIGADMTDSRGHGASIWVWICLGILGLLTVGLVFRSIRQWR